MSVLVWDPDQKRYVEFAPGQSEEDEADRVRHGVPGAAASARAGRQHRTASHRTASPPLAKPPQSAPTLPIAPSGLTRSTASMRRELARVGLTPTG